MNRQTGINPGALKRPRQMCVPGFMITLGDHAAGSALPRHQHDHPTICFVLAGGFSESTTGRVAECVPDVLKLTPAGEPHSNRFGQAKTRGIRIDVDRSRFLDVPRVSRALDEPYHELGGKGALLGRRLATEVSTADDCGLIAVEGLALELVAELARITTPATSATVPSWLVLAEDLIRARYRSATSVGDIAQVVGVHPATLARAYRGRYGCSIGARIRMLRVQHAARELLETDMPLSRVAIAAGFYDQSHFTNVFRRQLGVTPASYRKSHT